MPSEHWAPKLSALRAAFDREDLEVVAVYIETCDGVPDHAASVRAQVREHGLDYPVLDGEAGRIADPTRDRYPWAPRALVLDRAGRIVHRYPHMPQPDRLEADLATLVARDWIEPGPDGFWRGFARGAWVRLRVTGGGPAREEVHTLRKAGAAGVTVEVRATEAAGRESVRRIEIAARPTEAPPAVRREPRDFVVGERTYRCEVYEATWQRDDGRTITETSCLADDTRLPDRLLLRRTVETAPDGSRVERIRRVLELAGQARIGETTVPVWTVEESVTWAPGRTRIETSYSHEVPGGVVRRVTRTRASAEAPESESRVVAVAFGRGG